MIKKINLHLFSKKKNRSNHLIRFMKITTILICGVFMPVFASNAHPGNQVITTTKQAATVSEVIKLIEEQTDYLFIYDKKNVDVNRTVNLSADKQSVESILRTVFRGTDTSFALEGKHIVLTNSHIKASPYGNEHPQDKRGISGIVVDNSGEPIIGANIVVAGTSNGTITDINGNFSLGEVSEKDKLQISYIGYITKELAVGKNTNFRIELLEDMQAIDEVVVVGYGTQRRVNLSGAVAQVDSKELANRPISNISSGIQGLMPGVTVTSGQGRPGGDGSTIRIRGVGTLNSASPYILIDGIEAGSMNQIDPNDIESISVLKDASSAAIYGSKASNGVILITTKRGKAGATRISYSGNVGIQNPTRMVERLGSADYATLYNKALVENGKSARFSEEDIQKFRDGSSPYTHPNTDWYEEAYKTGLQHQHNVNVNGGTENVKYMASIGFLGQNGILPNSQRQQFNGRTNLDMKLSNRLNGRMTLAYIKNDYKDPNSSYAGGSSDQTIRQLNIIAPWIVSRYEDGTYGTISDGNPIAWLDLDQTVDRYNQNFLGIVALDYQIFESLKATVQGSYVNDIQHYKAFQKFIRYNPNKASDPNKLDEMNSNWNRTNFEALLNYDKTFGLHGIKALLGWHTEKYNYRYDTMSRKNFPNNELTDMNAGDPSSQQNRGYTRELAMLSWFGRVNYDYAGKYLLEANLRADASSRFADGHRWGYFPSFSGAWRLSEEGFMENAKGWLTNLKIRGSWGLLGNQDALSGSGSNDYYPWMNTYEPTGSYPFGGSLSSGYYQRYYKKEDISWEKARTWGIGLDLTINNKINASVDYYDRKTTDIIMEVPVPEEFALDPYMDNIGSMSNKGIEVSLGYNNRWNDWTFSANGNFSYNKNKLLNLGGVGYTPDPNENMRRQIGKPINSYYIYQSEGFFQSDADAQAYMDKYAGQEGYPFSKTFKGGDLIYSDVDGDGKITDKDRVFYKSTNPSFTFGLNLNAGYKQIDLSMIFTGAAGVGRLLNNEAFGDFKGDNSHPSAIWLNAWTPENTNAEMPRVSEGTTSPSHPSNTVSTFWIQNTSYVRLKNLQLGYTFPAKGLNKAGISKLRIYYSAENLLTFDAMPIKLDPETAIERGSAYPLIQTHSFGVNISF